MRTIEESIDDLLHDIESFIGGNITERQNELLNEILEIHKEEKRPKGKWIPYEVKLPDRIIFNYKCSVCGRKLVGYSTETLEDAPYCHCGADMRESEVKE